MAFTTLASELGRDGSGVTLIGAGFPQPNTSYQFLHAGAVRRERFEQMPKFPPFRGDTAYEEATFVPGLLRRFRPTDYDITMTCSYPFVNWLLRRPAFGPRPAHVFVTQNGNWPVTSKASEYRFFNCDGLVCTNPEYYEKGKGPWLTSLIPNGVDLSRFAPGSSERQRFGLPEDVPVVLMVSALIASKRVADGICAIASMPGVHLVCAGDGCERELIDELAAHLMPDRFKRLTIQAADMPALYRSADAFLHLSLDEPFGNVFIEALACGLPIVGQDSARTRWIVGNDQFLCNTTNRAALVTRLRQALSAKNNGTRGRREIVQRFDWPIVARQYRDFFEKVIARKDIKNKCLPC